MTGGDLRAFEEASVGLHRRAEFADGVGDEGMNRLAAEVEALGECRHDHRRPDVPDRAAEQDYVVVVDRLQLVCDLRAGIRILFTHVASDGRFIVVRIWVGRLDAIDVGVNVLSEHRGEHLGVADLEVTPSAVAVVLTGAREVGDQDLAVAARGGGLCSGLGGPRPVEA